MVFTTLDILQLTKIHDYESIYSVNPLYLIINHASRYIEEKGVNKYFVFDSTDENTMMFLMVLMELETKSKK